MADPSLMPNDWIHLANDALSPSLMVALSSGRTLSAASHRSGVGCADASWLSLDCRNAVAGAACAAAIVGSPQSKPQ